MSVVYITNLHPDHDYQAATEFGALVPVTSGNYPVFQTQRMLEEIAEALRISSADDFLLMSGSSVVASLCIAVWLAMHEQVNLLVFERKHGRQRYVVRTVARSEILINVELARERQEVADGKADA